MTILRNLEYQELIHIPFQGTVLDIGGSKKSGYHELMHGCDHIVTMNINPAHDCDIIADVEQPFPFSDATFDGAVALNLLEHVYRYAHVVQETHRILKPGGLFVIAVPFYFNIHGSPDDYFRYTKSGLERICREAGFTNIHIQALGYQVFSAFHQSASGIFVFPWLIRLMHILCINLDRFGARLSRKYAAIKDRIPLGYIVTAYRPVTLPAEPQRPPASQ